MLKFNRKIEYGLMAMKHLHHQEFGRVTSARDISGAYGVPFDLLSKVLQRLHNKGFIRSIQGINGGYVLNRQLDRINLAEFMEAIEGPIAVANCLAEGGLEACSLSGSCNIIPPMASLNQRILGVLAGMSLAEVAAPGSPAAH